MNVDNKPKKLAYFFVSDDKTARNYKIGDYIESYRSDRFDGNYNKFPFLKVTQFPDISKLSRDFIKNNERILIVECTGDIRQPRIKNKVLEFLLVDELKIVGEYNIHENEGIILNENGLICQKSLKNEGDSYSCEFFYDNKDNVIKEIHRSNVFTESITNTFTYNTFNKILSYDIKFPNLIRSNFQYSYNKIIENAEISSQGLPFVKSRYTTFYLEENPLLVKKITNEFYIDPSNNKTFDYYYEGEGIDMKLSKILVNGKTQKIKEYSSISEITYQKLYDNNCMKIVHNF